MPGLLEALDPAAADGYRRGYRHGAKAIIEAVEGLLSSRDAEALRTYLEEDLYRWSHGEQFQPPPLPVLSNTGSSLARKTAKPSQI